MANIDVPDDVRKQAHRWIQDELAKENWRRDSRSMKIMDAVAYSVLGDITSESDNSHVVPKDSKRADSSPERQSQVEALSALAKEIEISQYARFLENHPNAIQRILKKLQG